MQGVCGIHHHGDEVMGTRHTRGVGEDEQGHEHEVLRLARQDLDANREWKARDRLVARVGEQYDPQALELLGEVLVAMRDLPAAGAAWFGTQRRGEDVETAVAAWRERHQDSFAALWSSLPRPVREHEGNARVDALRRRVEQAGLPTDGGTTGTPDGQGEGVDAAVVIAVGVGILFVVCAVVGFVALVRWLVPGV